MVLGSIESAKAILPFCPWLSLVHLLLRSSSLRLSLISLWLVHSPLILPLLGLLVATFL